MAFGLRVLLRLRCHTLLRELIGKWVLPGSTRRAGGLSPSTACPSLFWAHMGGRGRRWVWLYLKGQMCLNLTSDFLAGPYISSPQGTPGLLGLTGLRGNSRFLGTSIIFTTQRAGLRSGEVSAALRTKACGCPRDATTWRTKPGKGTEGLVVVSPT